MNYQRNILITEKQNKNNNSSSDPKCRMVEHIIAHYNNTDNFVRNVLNETKVGAIGQPVIINMIRNVIRQH